jgi:hypothetical protein
MKPHIVKFRHLWYCFVRGHKAQFRVTGEGFTPLHAYSDWKARQA